MYVFDYNTDICCILYNYTFVLCTLLYIFFKFIQTNYIRQLKLSN